MELTTKQGICSEVIPCTGRLDAAHRSLWQKLAAECRPRTFFRDPTWFETAWATRTVAPWRLLVVRDRHRPIGLLPLRRRCFGSAEVVTHLSTNIPPVLVAVGQEEAFWNGVACWFAQASGLGYLCLGRTSNLDYVGLAEQVGRMYGLHAICRQIAPVLTLALPGSWEAYLAGLGKNARENARKSEHLITRDCPDVTITILERPDGADEALETLVDLYRRRWRNTSAGMVNTFDDARNVTFYREIIHQGLERGEMGIGVLRLGTRIIAVATLLHTPGEDTGYAHFLARDVAALPNRYSPGLYLINHQIRWLITRGATRLHLGCGNTGYKTMLGGQEFPQWTLAFARSPAHAAVLPQCDRVLHVISRLPIQLRHRLSLHALLK